MFIVIVSLMNPVRVMISNLLSGIFGKKKDKSSSHRKYKKINSLSNSCSACGTSSSNSCVSSSKYSSSKYSSSKYSSDSNKCQKNKKCKVKLSKKKINKILQQFKLD
jgi:hypothetical protein